MIKGFNVIFVLICSLFLAACSNFSLFEEHPHGKQYSDNIQLDKASSKNIGSKAIAPKEQLPPSTAALEPGNLGGSVERNMDMTDKNKMYHALDNALGKSTKWTNATSNITFTVVPLKKVVINENPFCRVYRMSASRSGEVKQSSGTACVNNNGAWEAIN